MVHLIGIIGAMLGGLFTGAALSESLDRNGQSTAAGGRLLTALAIGSGTFSIATWVHGEGILWLVAGVLVLLGAPRWGKLLRTTMGGLAVLLYIVGILHL